MPAVLELAPEIVAAVALVAILAVYFAVQALQAIAKYIGMPNWPLIGGALYGAISQVVTWVGDALGWLWQHANPINMFMATTHWLLHELNAATESVVGAVYSTIYRVATVSIPAAMAYAHTVAYGLYYLVLTDITAAETYAHTVAYGFYLDAVSWANVVGHSVATLVVTDIAAVNYRIDVVEGMITTATLGLVQTVEGWALQELGALRTWVTGEITTAVDGVESDIGAAVHGLEQTIAPEIAGAAAVGAAAAAAFEAWKSSCGDPLCTNLNGFGNIIATIEGVITDGALIALIAGAISDPQGTVTFIDDNIVAPATSAVETVAGALGFTLPAAA
jgi:hypothetical protein